MRLASRAASFWRMIRSILLALALTAAPLTGAFAFQDTVSGAPAARDTVIVYGGPDPVIIETGEGEVTLTAEIADTPARRERGLMWREQLADDAGMLFDFEVEQPVAIWMQNTLIPLDIIYIREDGTIAKIIAHAQAMSRRQLPSGEPVLGVLEIGAGRAMELGIEPGDLVRHAMFGTAASAIDQQDPSSEEVGDDSPTDAEAQPEEG